MKKVVLSSIILLASLVLITSCAKEEGPDLSNFRQESFDRWMAKYHPEATRLETGMYIQWFKQNSSDRKLNEGYWMELDYTGRDQNNDVFISRNKDIARQVGFFDYTTHYVPEFSEFLGSYTGTMTYNSLTTGQLLALKMMHEGDSVRIYLPPQLAYPYGFSSSSSSSSFNASSYSPSGINITAASAIVFDMKLSKVISDPLVYERNAVERYAKDTLGITNMADTVTVGMFMRKDLVIPDGKPISSDSTVSVYYIGRYLDGFIFDTNIDSIAKQNNIYTGKEYNSLSFKPDLGEGASMVKGFSQAALHMKYGEQARVVFVSGLGYGADGKSPIPAYTPLVFDIYIEKHKSDKEEDEK